MGELIDLTLVRRAYRILDNFVGDRRDLPRDDEGEACVDTIDQTIEWCADWIERRGGRSPSSAERKAMRKHLVGLFDERSNQAL